MTGTSLTEGFANSAFVVCGGSTGQPSFLVLIENGFELRHLCLNKRMVIRIDQALAPRWDNRSRRRGGLLSRCCCPLRDDSRPPVGRDAGRRHTLRLGSYHLGGHITANPRPSHPYVVRRRRIAGAVHDAVLDHIQGEFSPDARTRCSELLNRCMVRSQPSVDRTSALVGPNLPAPGQPAAFDFLHGAQANGRPCKRNGWRQPDLLSRARDLGR